MEKQMNKRSKRGNIEENILAIIDTTTESKDTRDANDDRLAFLEAIHASSIVPQTATPPSNKMYAAVFQILRVGKSLELIMASYSLLIKLNERYPRVFVSKSSTNDRAELVVVDELWSPFVFMDLASGEKESADKKYRTPVEYAGFHGLIQDLAEVVNETNLQAIDTKSLGNMLLFQYLVNVLDGDFVPRNSVYKETMNWTLLRESLLNMLLGSRRINHKAVMKDCLSILCGLCQVNAGISNDLIYPEKSVANPCDQYDTAVANALVEIEKGTCIAMQKLLIMIMELDESKKKADMERYTTRADGVRTPLLEIILDELTYDRDILSPFLKVFNEPKWKLEIILQYFLKYIAKPSVRTRRSNGSTDDATFNGVLKSFSNSTSTRSITKKISTDVVQLLLAHAFKAHLALPSQHVEGIFDSKEELRGNSLAEICKNIISAFNSLRRTDEKLEILPLEKEVLFAAAAILSTNS